MDHKFYSVEQVSEMLNLHPKTTRRYIREGKLKANKVGKQWRITGHDLSVFIEGNGIIPSSNQSSDFECFVDSDKERSGFKEVLSNNESRASVSTVIDIQVFDKDEADRISNTLVAVMNSKDPQYGKATINIQYLENNKKIRVMLWGTLFFTETMLNCLSILVEQN